MNENDEVSKSFWKGIVVGLAAACVVSLLAFAGVRVYQDYTGTGIAGNSSDQSVANEGTVKKVKILENTIKQYFWQDVDEEKLMEDALEAGAIDFLTDDGVFDVRTEPADFSAIREDLEQKGYTFLSAEIEYVPSTYTTLTNEDDIKNMGKMLEMFEDNDDVQAVWHNWENADDAE